MQQAFDTWPDTIGHRPVDGVCRGVVATTVDGALTKGGKSQVLLLDDGATHKVEVTLG